MGVRDMVVMKPLAGGTVKLTDFIAKHGLKLEITERSRRHATDHNRYYARFEHCEVMENGFLAGASGNGESPEAAVRDYCREIGGQRIAIDAMKPTRKEIEVPNEIEVDW